MIKNIFLLGTVQLVCLATFAVADSRDTRGYNAHIEKKESHCCCHGEKSYFENFVKCSFDRLERGEAKIIDELCKIHHLLHQLLEASHSSNCSSSPDCHNSSSSSPDCHNSSSSSFDCNNSSSSGSDSCDNDCSSSSSCGNSLSFISSSSSKPSNSLSFLSNNRPKINKK